RPANKEELFNLWYASAQNIAKCIFGVIKCCFRILLLPLEYPIEIQALIPVALCIVYNIIRSLDEEPDSDSEMGDSSSSIVQEGNSDGEGAGVDDEDDNEVGDIMPLEDEEGEVRALNQEPSSKALQDCITEEMWWDYQNHLRSAH
ncbi:hypothetical protein PISMIDRAFT_93463, partial [Pisolithus microcarpus 441]